MLPTEFGRNSAGIRQEGVRQPGRQGLLGCPAGAVRGHHHCGPPRTPYSRRTPGVSFVPVAGHGPSRVVLAWRAGEFDRLVLDLIDIAAGDIGAGDMGSGSPRATAPPRAVGPARRVAG
ncbi:hypothetical protein AB0I22_33120 [Streptomyces sp. NPDC050610]|uniref:hypothetical protein n=1 Tax=Streptomyces sp. NPDC050610 TaxID=3157097 RepID=UPI00341DE157